eukprot:TRINITY_DN61879_c0_g1_i1.p1 TRINITY_DN61879_c0_g1~~TRINITY_DN61879_c0_g1_i1.p1  ORF type:complete len:730 (+),score=85.27 TRINITY_DN61879_c0_g1_i1:231-2420(+)
MAPSRPVGACKPVFVGVSDKALVVPIAPRGVTGANRALGRRPVVSGNAGATAASPLAARLHARFSEFQGRAKLINDSVSATHLPVDRSLAEGALERYSAALAQEMRAVRDDVRKDNIDDRDKLLSRDHARLCHCLSIWELLHDVVLSSAPSAPRILHWCNRHFLEKDILQWYQSARDAAENGCTNYKTGFWDPVCRLALSDCKTEVVELLQLFLDKSDKADIHVQNVCDFLRRIPSMRQMGEFFHAQVEIRQATHEIHVAATQILRDVPESNPVRALLEIFAGCPPEAFEAGRDFVTKWSRGRSWIQYFALAHAWIFPDCRRCELEKLLCIVGNRREQDTLGHVDSVLIHIINQNIAAVVRLVDSACDDNVDLTKPVRGMRVPREAQQLPSFLVAHMVDVLFHAGKLPDGMSMYHNVEAMHPRDWYLMTYAEELCSGSRAHNMYAVTYLRVCRSPACRRFLELVARNLCGSSRSDAEFEESLDLLIDLGFSERAGKTVCRGWAQNKRSSGDLRGCLRWVCRSEHFGVASGAFVSEFIDELAEDNLEDLLTVLRPPDMSEPLDRYPPEFLVHLLVPWKVGDLRPLSGEVQGDFSGLLAPSGRLYFYTQYARCRACRLAGALGSVFAPTLVHLLASGVVPPNIVPKLIEEELWPVLCKEENALEEGDVMSLMHFVHTVSSDPFRRIHLTLHGEPFDAKTLHHRLGICLSRAILKGPAKCQDFPMPPLALLA